MSEGRLCRILVVDDEPNIVSAVKRELGSARHGRYRYEVEGFSDPLSALDRAKEQAFDVIISDYRMPEMSGLELLTNMAEIQPDCARIVLSGQTDREALTHMINETHIYRFIPKPWNDYLLKGVVAQAMDYSATLTEYRRLATLVRDSEFLTLAVPEREIDHILIVDADPDVLSRIARVLTQRSNVDAMLAALRTQASHLPAVSLNEDSIAIRIAPQSRSALKMAESQVFSCVIAGFNAGEMNGVELLQRFAALQPDCMRILVGGSPGMDELVAAVGAAQIFAFIEEPWADFDLRTQIAWAISQRRMLRENRRLAAMVSSRPVIS